MQIAKSKTPGMGERGNVAQRIFVALPISAALQEEILAWEERFRHLPVRWLKGTNLHITLVPPWYERDVAAVGGKLRTLAGTGAPCELCFRRVSFGPEERRPRLIWAGGETPPALPALKAKIEETLGVVPERRPFRLHLTVARFRPEAFPSFPVQKLDEAVLWRDAARSFVLMEAVLLPSGAEYRALLEVPL